MHRAIWGAAVMGVMLAISAEGRAATTEPVPAAEFSLNPGLAIPTGREGADNSFSLDGNVLYRIHNVAQLGPDFGFIFGSDLEESGNELRVFHLAPLLRIGPVIQAPPVKWQPFVVAGGGYYWSHLSGAGEDEHNGGWNIGGGVSFHLPQNFALGFEVRHHQIVYTGDDRSFVVPALRLTLLFP